MAQAKFEAESRFSENRQHMRTPIRIAIDYQWDQSARMNRSANLSEEGVFIYTDHPLAEGTSLRLSFILPEILEKIDAQGQVVWRSMPGNPEPSGMGVKFNELDPRQKALISDLKSRMVS